MNNVPNQQPPVMPQMSQMPDKPASSAGTVVAVLVILAVLVIGGFYFWGQRAEAPNPAGIEQTQLEDAAIEADLNATDVDNVDYDLDPNNFNAS